MSLEWLGALLALAMVVCNARVMVWGWPLAVLSSCLYGWVFAEAGLYGEAALQAVFVAMALWGWGRWWRQRQLPAAQALNTVRGLTLLGQWQALVFTVALWAVLAQVLAHFTDSTVPWWDALGTAGSVMGTWLLAYKFRENWWWWTGVNAVSVGLFVHKALWPTAALYALFTAMSLWGAWRWRARSA